jgi:hypothetical protein
MFVDRKVRTGKRVFAVPAFRGRDRVQPFDLWSCPLDAEK